MDWLILLSGLVLLLASGESLVRGAVSAALRFRVSTLVIGLTVVSIGTSAPELFVCLKAAYSGHDDISVGNVVGSNIANLGLVLGFTALLFPIGVERKSLTVDWPVMMGASLVFWWFLSDLTLDTVEGAISILILGTYIVLIIRKSRKSEKLRESIEEAEEIPEKTPLSFPVASLLVILGCVGLVFGSEWFLQGAVLIAKDLGVTDHVIGATLVAFGTSVPELATSCVAMFKKEAAISVGNLMGSNMFSVSRALSGIFP